MWKSPRWLVALVVIGVSSVLAQAASKMVYTKQLAIWKMREDGTGKAAVTSPYTEQDSHACTAPNGSDIYFEGLSSGVGDIYKTTYNGSSFTNLTNGSGNSHSPDPGSNGLASYVFFWSDRDTDSTHRGGEIYRMNLDGTNVVRMTTNDYQDRDPAWCGTDKIVFARSDAAGENAGYFHIWIKGLDPNDTETQISTYSGDEQHPDCSPSGQYVAYDRYYGGSYSNDIYEIDRNNSNAETNLTESLFGNYQDELDPSYSSGGSSIVFTFHDGGASPIQWDIHTYNRALQTETAIANTSSVYEAEAQWGELP